MTSVTTNWMLWWHLLKYRNWMVQPELETYVFIEDVDMELQWLDIILFLLYFTCLGISLHVCHDNVHVDYTILYYSLETSLCPSFLRVYFFTNGRSLIHTTTNSVFLFISLYPCCKFFRCLYQFFVSLHNLSAENFICCGYDGDCLAVPWCCIG